MLKEVMTYIAEDFDEEKKKPRGLCFSPPELLFD